MSLLPNRDKRMTGTSWDYKYSTPKQQNKVMDQFLVTRSLTEIFHEMFLSVFILKTQAAATGTGSH